MMKTRLPLSFANILSTIVSCLALSSKLSNHLISSREFFLKTLASSSALLLPSPAPAAPATSAMEFVPASPFFSSTFDDAIDILSTQRIACDNIVDVIIDGNLNEAFFKMSQLTAQTRVAGKIIIDSMQNGKMSKGGERISVGGLDSRSDSTSDRTTSSEAINTIKFLKCQEKFAILMDTCGESELQIEKALRGKYGASAAAQLKVLASINNVKSAFDDFLVDFLENTINTTL